MSVYFKKLNLPISFLKDTFDISTVKRTSFIDVDTILNPELIRLTESSGMVKIVNCIVLRYIASATPSSIHIDDNDVYDQTNLNFVIGGSDSKVFWYKLLNGYSGYEIKTPFATRKGYDVDKLQLVESVSIDGACLFQGAVPHNVINEISDRWCVSVKLKKTNNEWLDWNTALDVFEPFIIQ
jgi:hypothetical protein